MELVLSAAAGAVAAPAKVKVRARFSVWVDLDRLILLCLAATSDGFDGCKHKRAAPKKVTPIWVLPLYSRMRLCDDFTVKECD